MANELVKKSQQLSPADGSITVDAIEVESSGALTPNKQGNSLDTSGARGLVQTSPGVGGSGKQLLGERLVELGMITKEQLKVALQEKNLTGKLLGNVLVELGFISEMALTTVLAEASGYEVFDPKFTIMDGEALALIPPARAKSLTIIPVALNDGVLTVAMSDPYDVVTLDTLKNIVPKGVLIKPAVTSASIIIEAIETAYGYASQIDDILKELEKMNFNTSDVTKLTGSEAYTHPIVRLVNSLVSEAVKVGASDIHFEPEENFIRLRYRVDGVLFTAQILHKSLWSKISQRIKIISEMNIADKLAPQDGRFEITVAGRRVDFRVSCLPSVHGENIVMRILDKSASIKPLTSLGFSDENMKKIRTAQAKPEGIVIVTGPTGSGKSTSLYSMLNEMNSVDVNIKTLEDPVEYSIPMIRQTAIREGVLEFSDGIKAILRQDPDIVFIGEIRDGTTAEMALKAAMTGHQVYTTLHTNDSFGAIPRLLDLGLKPGMIAGAIIAVFAQRLVRRLCVDCKEEYLPDQNECDLLKVDASNPPKIFKARQGGCQTCKGQGYKGRINVAEILLLDDDLDEIIARSGTKQELKKRAVEKGFKNMRDDGMLKVLQGLTSVDAIASEIGIV